MGLPRDPASFRFHLIWEGQDNKIFVIMIRPALELPPELLAEAGVLPSRKHLLEKLPTGRVFAEIGVGLGIFTRGVLKTCRPSHFLAVDNFQLHQIEVLWGKPTLELFEGKTHRAYYESLFIDECSSGRMTVREGDSAEIIRSLPDQSVDILYLDADHSYEGVKRDLAEVDRKITRDGFLILNDYTFLENVGSKGEYGVIQAGHEFMVAHGWQMVWFVLQPYMFCDVCLRRLDRA